MRQKKALRVTVLVAVVLSGLLVLFACGRGGEESGRNGGTAGGSGAAHEEHPHGGDDSTTREPSGNLQDGVRVVEVKARQFEFEPSTIVVNQGEKVRLEVTSQDVTHGIAIEDMGIDRELPPNETQSIAFTAEKAGRHHFHCSVYCGEGHSDMHGELVIQAADAGSVD